MKMEDWLNFLEPAFPVRFRHPEITPQGLPIDINRQAPANAMRVHLVSRDSKEVYFEVSRFSDISAQDGYAKLKAEVEERLNATVSALQPATLAGLPSFEMRLQWGDTQRFVTFVPKDAILYRVICDPTSDLNLQIRSTLEFR